MSREFQQFCTSLGLIVHALKVTGPGQTIRVPTLSHPKKENGWYRYDGRFGCCGIWGELETQQFKPGAEAKPLSAADFAHFARIRAATAKAEAEKHASAALKAAALLKAADMRSHAYIARKGFPELLTPTLDDGATLLVTMWDGKRLANLQRINEAGEKKFLPGGEVTGMVHRIGDQGVPILAEGYASGLSVAAAIKASRMRAHVVICFSAGNLVHVATRYKDARIACDNDDLKTGTGEKAAKATGLKYFMPPVPGQDFNDLHREKGLFAASQIIRTLLLS